jgi:hypothetical protein
LHKKELGSIANSTRRECPSPQLGQFDNLAGSAPIHRQMGQAHSLSLV